MYKTLLLKKESEWPKAHIILYFTSEVIYMYIYIYVCLMKKIVYPHWRLL